MRRFILHALIMTCAATPLAAAVSSTPDEAVEKGLAALVKLQTADGGIGDGSGITALSGMALLSGGHTPTRGRYREASAKALKYVLAARDKHTGYLGAGMGNMYAHGFATLYLAECYGMAPDPELRKGLEAAVDLIQRCQNSEGGWRYAPAPLDADISVTICQVMAIRAANNVGVGGGPDGLRNQQIMEKAVSYVRRCANADGSFNYTAGSGGGWGTNGPEGIPRCAAGTMCLIGAGIHETTDPVLGPSLRFLQKHVEAHAKGRGDWYWYGQYYSAQALFHSPDPTDWDRYWAVAAKAIIALQSEEGVWNQPDSYGPAYGTAMALIILQIPNNYLPIFQR
ncbi:MAG: terpene cyclase/mutase family protein [Planctomycetes bacterium]|nr:terpene cyclase/mutase family protein [Planctomycetota bacterium]